MSDEVELVACANCSSEYSPDDLATTPSGDVLCPDCRIYCERCDDYSYEDNSPQHMESYWAENLTVRFRMPYYINTSYKYLASAGCPALADCNNDG